MLGDNRRLAAANAAQEATTPAPTLVQQTLTQMGAFDEPPPPASSQVQSNPVPSPSPVQVNPSPSPVQVQPVLPIGWREHIDYLNSRVVYVHNTTGRISILMPTTTDVPIVTPLEVASSTTSTSLSIPTTVVTPDGAASAGFRTMPRTPAAYTSGTSNEPIELFSDSSVDSDIIKNIQTEDVIAGLRLTTVLTQQSGSASSIADDSKQERDSQTSKCLLSDGDD